MSYVKSNAGDIICGKVGHWYGECMCFSLYSCQQVYVLLKTNILARLVSLRPSWLLVANAAVKVTP